MARKKASNGVVATIERLTGKMPCPPYLRTALNKYLRKPHLFDGVDARRYGAGTQAGKLNGPGSDNLVHNLLALDGVFRGDTGKVIGIIDRTISADDLDKELKNAEAIMRERVNIYGYWLDRLSSLHAVLADPTIDLKTDRLDERLAVVPGQAASARIPPFALHALMVHEQSEQKARVGLPGAAEYIERADAYLALDDLANADRNACAAIGQDGSCARGWFIRVAVALRRRDAAMRIFHQKQMEAQEVAEPMSAHERWAIELADEAAGDAQTHQAALIAILPQAIQHWPRTNGYHDHQNLWTQVRKLFVGSMFTAVARDMRGLTNNETQAVTELITVYDAHPSRFFIFGDEGRFATDLHLYHLRHVLRLDGADAHWASLQAAIDQTSVDRQATDLMRDPIVAQIWQMHYCRNRDESALMSSYAEWLSRALRRDTEHRLSIILPQYAYLYHRAFERQQFGQCDDVAAQVIGLLGTEANAGAWGPSMPHPGDGTVYMPVHRLRYWQYLAALAAVEQRRQGGELSSQAQAILENDGNWRQLFTVQRECFWVASEEYEGGGGDEWPEPPYGIDLSMAENWRVDRPPTGSGAAALLFDLL